MERRTLLKAGATGLLAALLPGRLWAGEADVLAHVDPELRRMAAILLRAENGKRFAAPDTSAVPVPSGVERVDVPAAVPGQPAVPVYVINRPTVGAPPRGAILHIHGGGFVSGSARMGLRPLMRMADRLGCVIVTVDYRLAPATRFPGPVDDAFAALVWLRDNAAALGVDPARIALMGESAGGGLAAMLAIAVRDRGTIRPVLQALVYPMLDDRTGSSRPVAPPIGTLVWTPARNREGWAALLGQPPGRKHVPYGAVPARVDNLAGLPPTFISVGSLDLFADEDIDYARRLVAAGVSTELLVVPGGFHGSDLMVPGAWTSRRMNDAVEAALGRALAPKGD